MRLGKFFQCASLLTILALGYIHLQVRIIELAYQNNRKQKQIRQLIESNGYMRYTIALLKSANYLGIKMLAEDSEMQFVHPDHIIRISDASDLLRDQSPRREPKRPTSGYSLSRFLTAEAQADVGGGYIVR